MTDPKSIYIAEHERLTADAAYDAMRDRYADMADMARMRAKENF